MPTKEEFENYIKKISDLIKIIQESKMDDSEKERLTDELLERISIATKYFLPDEDED